jgi:hypothetical protein
MTNQKPIEPQCDRQPRCVDGQSLRLLERVRLARAEPEPEGPTDDELLEINDGAYFPGTDEVNDEDNSSWQHTSDYIRWLDENGTPEEQEAYAAKGLRAVFEAGRRWIRPAPNPVERLPGPEDCDAEGRCWLLTVEDEYPQWRLCSIQGAQLGGAMIWVPVDRSPGVMVDSFFASHWLPANALPLPKEVV